MTSEEGNGQGSRQAGKVTKEGAILQKAKHKAEEGVMEVQRGRVTFLGLVHVYTATIFPSVFFSNRPRESKRGKASF